MQSPKFRFLEKELGEVFSKKLLAEEWKSRVKQQIRKQQIFDPIEYRDYSENISRLIEDVRRDILSGTYSVRLAKRYLEEKSRGLCRQMTLVHPRDLLVLERLSRAVYFSLKASAPSKSAFFEPDDGRFVKGFMRADFQYGSYASWRRFQKAIFGFANENKFIVVTDVANFYDFISFQHLRNIISSWVGTREAVLDLLIFVLNRLTWTPDFMPLTQVGMPQIETTASRVLANAMLFEIDQVCEASAVSNYARFMDDIDVGVETIAQAKRIVRDVDLTLQSRQLRLNSAKTKILSQKDAYRHFCILENNYLYRSEAIIAQSGRKRLIGRKLIRKYETWLQRAGVGEPGPQSLFREGNGSKVHKYVLKLIYECDFRVPEADLIWLIKNDPGMRSTALRYLAASRRNNSNLGDIVALVEAELFVDDASYVDIAGYLLHARFRRTARCEELIGKFVDISARQGDIGLHAAIFVASRFLSTAGLLGLLKQYVGRISSDFWLARAAAGVLPRFIDAREFGDYINFLRDMRNEDADNVKDYILGVVEAKTFSVSLKAYLTAKNDTFPQKIYFPKLLLLLAASKNSDIARLIPGIFKVHQALHADPYYKAMGF